mmetsp:Transcript_20446/g.59271  ORF Transcript_20446/g.59271 Transcript_20446/m.59271 type:complete len:480 (+) Transcript_20446:380-1819(+)
MVRDEAGEVGGATLGARRWRVLRHRRNGPEHLARELEGHTLQGDELHLGAIQQRLRIVGLVPLLNLPILFFDQALRVPHLKLFLRGLLCGVPAGDEHVQGGGLEEVPHVVEILLLRGVVDGAPGGTGLRPELLGRPGELLHELVGHRAQGVGDDAQRVSGRLARAGRWPFHLHLLLCREHALRREHRREAELLVDRLAAIGADDLPIAGTRRRLGVEVLRVLVDGEDLLAADLRGHVPPLGVGVVLVVPEVHEVAVLRVRGSVVLQVLLVFPRDLVDSDDIGLRSARRCPHLLRRAVALGLRGFLCLRGLGRRLLLLGHAVETAALLRHPAAGRVLLLDLPAAGRRRKQIVDARPVHSEDLLAADLGRDVPAGLLGVIGVPPEVGEKALAHELVGAAVVAQVFSVLLRPLPHAIERALVFAVLHLDVCWDRLFLFVGQLALFAPLLVLVGDGAIPAGEGLVEVLGAKQDHRRREDGAHA